jgi:16S rRNA (guanine966-N2)-methyltransferase
MRVIAGTLKGRRLASLPAGAEVRPTPDRVREAVFSMLGGVADATVLDLYCGTGALAIEAISRGASEAVLVDRDTRLARRNVEALGLTPRCRLVRGDALGFLRRCDQRFDLVFCDPPYRLADRLEPELAALIPARLAEEGRLVLESPARRPLEIAMPLLADRRYGEVAVRIHGAPAAEAADG